VRAPLGSGLFPALFRAGNGGSGSDSGSRMRGLRVHTAFKYFKGDGPRLQDLSILLGLDRAK